MSDLFDSLIQGDFGSGGHGNFELVVPLTAAGGSEVHLWHYWHDNSAVSLPWERQVEEIDRKSLRLCRSSFLRQLETGGVGAFGGEEEQALTATCGLRAMKAGERFCRPRIRSV